MATILVVDDEPTIRVLIRASLEGAAHRIVDAADGEHGLAIARRERPDLVLLDVALPRMNGLEVCARLKRDPATAAIPILLLSGLVQEPERRAAAEAGADGFIAKPFSPAALVAQIEETLRHRVTVTSL